MTLQSAILAGNARLEQAAGGGPSVKKRPPDDDADAVRRIQNALAALGFPLPNSFPNGPGGAPDGQFGNETFLAVQRFQKQAFPSRPSEWDGRVGKNTLAEMDRRLPRAAVPPGPRVPAMSALAEQDKFTSLLWAQAALASLATARAFLQSGGGAIGPGQLQPPPLRIALQALETHFHFSTVIGSRLSAIDFITLIYQKTVNVLAQSRQFFIDDTTSQEALNGTPAHVPFGKGKVNFTPAFRARDATGQGFGPKCRAAMVLHEPVHVVDHPQASFAVNHVHENSTEYAGQPAARQIHNAHSYACFGQHCFFGSDTRFGIGKPDQ